MAAIAKSSANAVAPEMALTHALNFSRGTAALLVLFFHIRTTLLVPYESLEAYGWLARAVFSISTFGHDAVIIFLCSAVIWSAARFCEWICRLLATSGNTASTAVSESARSFLPFAIVLQRLMPPSGCADTPATILGNALALQNVLVKPLCNNLPLWSISNEVAYYLVFPVTIAATARAYSIRLAMELTSVVLIGLLSVSLSPLDDTNIVFDFPLWLVGAALWFVPGRFHRLRWLALLLLAGACCSAASNSAKVISGSATRICRRHSRSCW